MQKCLTMKNCDDKALPIFFVEGKMARFSNVSALSMCSVRFVTSNFHTGSHCKLRSSLIVKSTESSISGCRFYR